MAQFKAFDPDIEVNGNTVYAVVDGMGAFREYAEAILQQHGIPLPDPDAWVPHQAWLDAFRSIAERIGDKALYSIGRKIPGKAIFPEDMRNLEQGLRSIDIAYHMNHRRVGGRPLYDPSTGVMEEGIGHYGYEKCGEHEIRMVCDTPYPCDVDRGIIAAIAERFKPATAMLLRVEHDESQPCRKCGADSCTYYIRW